MDRPGGREGFIGTSQLEMSLSTSPHPAPCCTPAEGRTVPWATVGQREAQDRAFPASQLTHCCSGMLDR